MKFRVKLALCMVSLLAVIFGTGGSLLISQSFNNAYELEVKSAKKNFQMVCAALQLVDNGGMKQASGDMASAMRQLETQNAWSAARLRYSDADTYSYEAELFSPCGSDLSDGTGRIKTITGEDGSKYLLLSADISSMRLDIAYNTSALYDTLEQQEAFYYKAFIILVLAGAAVSWALSYVLTRPLGTLTKTAGRFASGELSARANVKSNDEIGRLADSFNDMASKVETSMTQMRDAVERQERFMGSFSHEMKTPMTSIIGYADLLRGGTLSSEEQTDAANYIFSEGKRLENLSLKLLDILVAKKREPVLTKVSPSQLISGLAEHLEPLYRQGGIHLQYNCEEGICLLDADLVKALLINLLDNARKAVKCGGSIFIKSQMLSDGCRIQITDNGCGISEESLTHLTEEFFRVDKSRSRASGGVGLGLTLCREIAEMHHGRIDFESQVGQGTVVTVEFREGGT